MAKLDLPNANIVGSGNLTSELAQYNYLYSLVPRTTTTDITFTSSSSNVTYSTATYSSGKYANQGQNGMLSILGEILASYLITSSDFNSKTDQTKADVTYYVNTSTGNDSNNGIASGTAFKTIAKAIGLLPQIINHAVTIYIADGIYNEIITLSGYFGEGHINLTGNVATPTNCNVLNVVILSIPGIFLTIQGFNCTSTTTNSFTINMANYVNLISCVSTSTTGTYYGVNAQNFTGVYINNCTFSNKNYSIAAGYGSQVYSNTNGGTGNTIGLFAYGGAKIAKSAGQPGGTTAEGTATGGQIM